MEKCIKCKNKPTDTGYAKTNRGNKMRYEHRIVYQETHPNENISEKIIHHICKNRWCVNPNHLIAITRKQHSAEHGLSGWAKIHAAKTHCKNGHLLDKKNNKQRFCSICRKISAIKWARKEYKKNPEKYRKISREYQRIKRLNKNL